MSTLPGPAQQAAQNALNASIASVENQGDASDEERPTPEVDDDGEGQVLETNAPPVAPDVDRTVFDDPKSFNVKVRYILLPAAVVLHSH